jgi:hypothetical protein
MTPTSGTTIYITETEDGTEPVDPAIAPVHPTWMPSLGSHSTLTPLTPAGYTAAFDAWKQGCRRYHFPEIPDQRY